MINGNDTPFEHLFVHPGGSVLVAGIGVGAASHPEAERTSRIDSLLKTGDPMFAVGIGLLLGVSALLALWPIDAVMWFVVLLLALRSGSNLFSVLDPIPWTCRSI